MSGEIQITSQTKLMCPACGENCITHEGVTVFTRSEDDEQTLVTETGCYAGDSVMTKFTPTREAGNPSLRRHGLAIQFRFETCPEAVGTDDRAARGRDVSRLAQDRREVDR